MGNSEAEARLSPVPAVSAWPQPAAEAPSATSARNGVAVADSLDAARTAQAAEEASTPRRTAAAAMKRTFDVVFATATLIVLAPVWIAIAIGIKLDSPGPVLFYQRRIGRGGVPFKMLKFRTMVRGADARKEDIRHLNEAAEGLFKIARDPRLTRFGRFLRTTSLDELPQLLNVIAGQMSVVGPRPLVPEEDALIKGDYRVRLQIRPGLTGPWQVAGASQIPIREMVRLDRDYVRKSTLVGDLRLIVGTVPHIVRRRGI